MTSSMPLDLTDSLQLVMELVNDSPSDVLVFYTGTSVSAEVAADPAVRAYANILRRLCLCFNHWNADWRDLIPGLRKWVNTWNFELSLNSAHATVLEALIARAVTVDAAKGLPDGWDTTPVGTFLRTTGPDDYSTWWQYPFQHKVPLFLSACAAELGTAAATATTLDKPKVFVDKALLTALPPGISLKAAARTAGDLAKSAEKTFPEAAAPAVPMERDVESAEPDAPPVRGNATDDLLANNGGVSNENAGTTAHPNAASNAGPPEPVVSTPPNPSAPVEPEASAVEANDTDNLWANTTTVSDDEENAGTTARPTATSEPGAPESVSLRADPSVPVVPVSAAPNIPAVPAVSSEPTTCPTCYELMPGDLPEREKKYTPDDLAAHKKAWHSDYATVRMWSDNQKKFVRGSSVWVCPSRRCFLVNFHNVKTFEKHVSDFHTHDGTISAEYLVVILDRRIRKGERSFPVQNKLTFAKQKLAAEQRGNIARLEGLVKEWEGRENDGGKEGEKQVQITTEASVIQKKYNNNHWNKMLDRMNAEAATDLLGDIMADADRRRFAGVYDAVHPAADPSSFLYAPPSASPYFSHNAEAGPSTLHQALDLTSKDSEGAQGAEESAANDAAKGDATAATSLGDQVGDTLTTNAASDTTSNADTNNADTMEVDELDADAGVKAENMDVD